MKRTFLTLIWVGISTVVWAQTPPLQTAVKPLTSPSELICINEDKTVLCSLYTLNGLNANWPWLNRLIREQTERDQPVLTEKHLSVPKGFNADKDWDMQREYNVSYEGSYRDFVGIQYGGWDYGNGGAHGVPYATFVLYDVKTQREVAFKDMVLPAKRKQLKQELDRSFDEWLNGELSGEAQELVKITDSVSFGPKGVVFYYNVYELGPYAMGTPELKLTWKQVLPLLKPEWRQRLQ